LSSRLVTEIHGQPAGELTVLGEQLQISVGGGAGRALANDQLREKALLVSDDGEESPAGSAVINGAKVRVVD
jgi:hypothetical protein